MSVLRFTEEQYAARMARKCPPGGQIGPQRVSTPPPSPTHTKYRNRPTGGYSSVKEARRAQALKLRQAAGEITDLAEQVRFELIPKQGKELACRYVADFTYLEADELVVEDVKSAASRKIRGYVIKRKLMLWIHGIALRET